MAKKGNKINNAAHIKRNTAGTSNEISFSVLDAAKNAQDEQTGDAKEPVKPRIGSVNLFTMGNKGKTHATPSRDREITLKSDTPKSAPREKRVTATSSGKNPVAKHRRMPHAFRVFLIVVAVVVVIGAGSFAAYEGYVNHQEKRQGLAAEIDEIATIDETLLKLDNLVIESAQAPLSELNEEITTRSFENIEPNLADIEKELEKTKAALQDMVDYLGGATEIEVANQALVSVNSRLNMVEIGKSIMEDVIACKATYDDAVKGYEILLKADSLARDAASLITNISKDNASLSIDKSNEAITAFREAYDYLYNVQKQSMIDVSTYLDYINLRIESQEYAIESDQAYLDRNKELAEEANNAYNETDTKAVELIKSAEGTPAIQVEQYLRSLIKDSCDIYASERSRAANSDSILRDYLGTVS